MAAIHALCDVKQEGRIAGRDARFEGLEEKAWKGLDGSESFLEPSALKEESAVGISLLGTTSAMTSSSSKPSRRRIEEFESARRMMVVSRVPDRARDWRVAVFWPSCLITFLSYDMLEPVCAS